jgi:hypothetical protein
MIGAGMAPKVLNFVLACLEIILQALSLGTPRRRQSMIEGAPAFLGNTMMLPSSMFGEL